MVGVLAVSFCGRRSEDGSICLDLWSYPDGTYNLVVEHVRDTVKVEAAFPCSLGQLAGVLNRRPLSVSSDQGEVLVETCAEAVCAEFRVTGKAEEFRYCIPMDDYRRALESLEYNVIGYVA